MPYIDHILQETLRMYPTLSNLTRRTMNDYQVPGTNDVIQKGLMVVIPIFAIQRDSRYYADPEKFSPDRFDGEEAKQRNSMLWLPFGEGPRSCIAARFGMMQARIGLVTILNNFEVSIGERTEITYEPNPLALTPKGGIYLKFKAINPNAFNMNVQKSLKRSEPLAHIVLHSLSSMGLVAPILR
ncbi:probable cytochrome P450 6a14 [Sitodiplosis mosellana]|uniref:probable cytochrome P450 6a14 n=1 Tax=Sitodiplosis mosellana TaxID=263140 RepID=UPI002443AA13|nr:probable cytochrome P450 6a14 [Sitodiplosis mosellana]